MPRGNHDYRTAAASPYFEYFGPERAGHACRRAAALLRTLGVGLREIGTCHEADACDAYAATLTAIVASGECCAVNSDGKVDLEQAAFVLEGIRDGLDNADLDEGADFVQRDIERLNDIVFRYNSTAGKAVS